MPCWFSKDIEYWKPEHPPPTTPMRRPAGCGSCVAMISFTLTIADAVRLTGWVDTGGALTTSGVVMAVAMCSSPLQTALQSILCLLDPRDKPRFCVQGTLSCH